MKLDGGKTLVLIRNLLCLVAISLVPIALFAGARQLTAAPRAAQHLEACAKNLRTLHAAIEAYRKDHKGRYPAWITGSVDPPGLKTDIGLYPKYVKDKSVFVCPDDPHEGKQAWNPGTPPFSYGYVGSCQAHYVGITNVDQTLGKKLFDELLTTMGKELRVISCLSNHTIPGTTMTIQALKADGSVVVETPVAGMKQAEMVERLIKRIIATTIYPAKNGVGGKKTGGDTTGK